jgi:hypothetical protein
MSGDTRTRQQQSVKPTVYCVVPTELPELRALLERHLREHGIEVVAERRGLDRRRRVDRRRGAGAPPADVERRRTNPEPERRTTFRRAPGIPIKPPVALPPEAERYADLIVFVERRPKPGFSE